MNLANLFARVASVRSTKVAVEDVDTALTYGDLEDLSSRLARFLLEQSVSPGHRVGV